MQITDLAKMKSLADKYNLLVIVDNTFLSPYFQKPIRFGADLVIHSGTKFLGGHNDTLADFYLPQERILQQKSVTYTKLLEVVWLHLTAIC